MSYRNQVFIHGELLLPLQRTTRRGYRAWRWWVREHLSRVVWVHGHRELSWWLCTLLEDNQESLYEAPSRVLVSSRFPRLSAVYCTRFPRMTQRSVLWESIQKPHHPCVLTIGQLSMGESWRWNGVAFYRDWRWDILLVEGGCTVQRVPIRWAA